MRVFRAEESEIRGVYVVDQGISVPDGLLGCERRGLPDESGKSGTSEFCKVYLSVSTVCFRFTARKTP